ncbi:hypothetical protein GCM10007276_05140 [Agaricicola taiwanensis]|uniref:Probable membrane transporter protein n=1 Tax=Agaricicola taiwanensis TaxID=591372 RepID=A0A8J2VIN6_9RHOB|nr:sulfite exporter TauE/SafE family protein [Agaricicola taiwanensis]GGE30934.1 hypothetical protein GCM10007276_05140 [Agaricicola taiwanensis]
MVQIFGVTAFEGATLIQVLSLVVIFGAAFFVKGVFGYGAVPLLIVAGSFVVGPHHAVLLAAVTNVMSHIQFIPDGLRYGRRDVVLRLTIVLVPSIAVGVLIFARISGGALSVLAGAVILASVLIDARGWLEPLRPLVEKHVRIVSPVFGLVAGLISGVIGAGSISFISLFLKFFAPDRETFRGTLILVTAVVLVWRVCMLAIAGEIGLQIVTEALLLLGPGLITGLVGRRVSKRLSDRTFFTAFQVVLCCGAVVLLFRGAMGG